MRYTKLALSFPQQIALLESRDLIIPDHAAAMAALGNVSYYRLSAYFKPFIMPQSEKFAAGTTFQQIWDLYAFDRELRFLFREPLECIELHFRTRITYELAMRGGAFAHTRADLFVPEFDHVEFLRVQGDVERKTTVQFAKHFRSKYHEEPRLPVWMATELMSFGTLSWLFPSLREDVQRAISKTFGVDRAVIKTWLECLAYIRNVCAHHSRLWNKELAIRPVIPRERSRWPYPLHDNKRCYVIILLLQDMLSRIDPGHEWKRTFAAFLSKRTEMELTGIQAPKEWKTIQPWRDIVSESVSATHAK
jgi:abortive infection bacteriophage resistance protein